jgi:hypothetical protein
MFHIRLSGEKAEPKPYYYDRMNPQELFVWEIIVSSPPFTEDIHDSGQLEPLANYP